MPVPDAVDLNFLARQCDRIISEVGMLRDDNRVLTAMVTRLDSAQAPILDQMRALQSLIGRLDERVRKLETDGMSPQQLDAIANRVLNPLSILIAEKLLPAIETRFRDIQVQLKDLRARLGAAR